VGIEVEDGKPGMAGAYSAERWIGDRMITSQDQWLPPRLRDPASRVLDLLPNLSAILPIREGEISLVLQSSGAEVDPEFGP
jgi:hypothetical protein